MDALNALREATVSGVAVKEEGGDLVIGEARFPVGLATPVRAYDGSHYPLGSLFVTFKFAGEKNATRLAEYRRLGVARVHFSDNKKILAYLRGQTTGEDIVDAAFVSSAPDTEPGAAPGAEGASSSSSSSSSSAAAAAASSSATSAAHMKVGAGAHLVLGGGGVAGGRAGSRAAAQAAHLQTILRLEIPIATRNSILSVPGADLRTAVFDLFSSSSSSAEAAGAKRSRSGKRLSTRERLAQARLEKEQAAAAAVGRPMPSASRVRAGPRGAAIIVVPNASSSLVTIHNAPRLLQDMFFVTPGEARSGMQAAGTSKPWKTTIQRQMAGGLQRFHVIDSVDRLQPGDWDKVVAIFTNGADWQFKGWRWGRKEGREDITPVEVFDRVPGFYLHFEDEAVPRAVSRWKVVPLGVSKSQRHLDKGLVARFWRQVDDFISVRKPYLMRAPSAAPPTAP